MKRHHVLILSLLAVTLVGLAAVVQPAAPAGAGDGGGGVQGGGGYALSVPGAGFVPDSSATTYRTDAVGGVALTAGASYTLMHTPVNLPDGAQITSLEFYFYDNDSSNYMQAKLIRNDPGTGSRTVVATASSPDGAPGYSSVFQSLATPEVIDNHRYDYEIEVYWSTAGSGSALKLMAAKVRYTAP